MKKIEYSEEHRVETGAVQFGDDWPGLFIRGDDAIGMLGALRRAHDNLKNEPYDLLILGELISIIENEVRV